MANRIDGESNITGIYERKPLHQRMQSLEELSKIYQDLETYVHLIEEKIGDVYKDIEKLEIEDLDEEAKRVIKEDLLSEKKTLFKLLNTLQARSKEYFNYLANLQGSIQESESKNEK